MKKITLTKSLKQSLRQRITDQCIQEKYSKFFNSSKLKYYQVVLVIFNCVFMVMYLKGM